MQLTDLYHPDAKVVIIVFEMDKSLYQASKVDNYGWDVKIQKFTNASAYWSSMSPGWLSNKRLDDMLYRRKTTKILHIHEWRG